MWLYTTQADDVVDVIATVVTEVLQKDLIIHKQSLVMPGWFNIFHNLFCNSSHTTDVVYADKG